MGPRQQNIERERWPIFGKRADSRTDICLRWSHQSVLVNDIIYIYGGQARTSSGQTTDTWSMLLLAEITLVYGG